MRISDWSSVVCSSDLFAVGDEAAAPPRPGMAELCPVIDASGGAPFQRHIVDVGDGDSATRLIYVADIHARSAIGRLCCPCRFRGQQGCPVINGTEADRKRTRLNSSH